MAFRFKTATKSAPSSDTRPTLILTAIILIWAAVFILIAGDVTYSSLHQAAIEQDLMEQRGSKISFKVTVNNEKDEIVSHTSLKPPTIFNDHDDAFSKSTIQAPAAPECKHHLGCSNDNMPKCDFANQNYLDGEWSRALPAPGSLMSIDNDPVLYQYQDACDSNKFRCHIASPNGCPQKSEHLTSFQWIPKHCSLRSFDAGLLDRRLGGRTIMFVGDSLMRQQFNSWRFLLRSVWSSEEDALRNDPEEFKTVGGNRFLFDWSKFLVDEKKYSQKDPKQQRLELLLSRDGWARKLMREPIDVIIMNVGHHWHKFDREFGRYNEMLTLVLNHIQRYFKGDSLVFRTSTPGHYDCFNEELRSQPIDYVPPLNSTNDPFNWRKPIKADLLWQKEAEIRGLGRVFQYLNVSHSIYRSDAHVEYKIRQDRRIEDCLHWCLPGVPGRSKCVRAQMDGAGQLEFSGGVISNKIYLDKVYLNGLHALKSFQVSSTFAYPVIVKFQSTLPDAIAFQLSNENLLLEGLSSGYNQIFNYVNHIESVVIQPGETVQIILAFLPGSTMLPAAAAASGQEDISAANASYEFSDMHAFIQVSYTRYLSINTGGEASGEQSNSNDGRPVVYDNGEDHKQTPKFTGDFSLASGAGEMVLKFRARICRSILWADIFENGLAFEDCIVGETVFKDFTVWNKSEIDLHWSLNLSDFNDTAGWFKFIDCESGEPLTEFKSIPSFSYRRIRIVLRPKDIGDFYFNLQFENSNDADNTETVRIHVIVRSLEQEDSLLISGGGGTNVIDFGDCYAGNWIKQEIVLKNVSESPIDVKFTAENATIVFELKTDEVEEFTSILPEERLDSVSKSEIPRSTDFSVGQSFPSSRASTPSVSRESLLETVDYSIAGAIDSQRSSVSGPKAVAVDSEQSLASSTTRKQQQFVEIDEIVLRAGAERAIQVRYKPYLREDLNEADRGKLNKHNFRVLVDYCPVGEYSYKRKIVQCKSRVCCSLIAVLPQRLNFGETDVGTLKSAPIRISNLSDLPARVELRFASKVLSCYRGEILIPPKQWSEVKIDIYPRKVNPEYHKQITVMNLYNSDNDQVLEVLSNNVDLNRVTFHSLFYRILTPSSTNFIDYGTVILNNPTVRVFQIENISKEALKLEVTSSLPDEIQIFTVAAIMDRRYRDGNRSEGAGSAGRSGDRRKLPVVDKRERMLVAIDSLGQSNSNVVSRQSSRAVEMIKSTDAGTTDYLDLASSIISASSTGKYSPRKYSKQAPSSIPRPGYPLDAVTASDGNQMRHSQKGVSPAEAMLLQDSGTITSGATMNAATTESGGIADTTDSPSNSAESFTANLGLLGDAAEISIQQPVVSQLPPAPKPPVSIMALLSDLEIASKNRLVFTKLSAEEKFVQSQISLQRDLNYALQHRQLIPISSLTIAAEKTESVVLIFTPSGRNRPYIQGKPKKQDAKLFIRLQEFDRSGVQAPEFSALFSAPLSEIPVRELLVRSSLCRSILEIGQRNINFGLVAKRELRSKTIVINNRSENPLPYVVRKSGSISSGDLHFSEGRMGVLRGFGKREVEFKFNPSLPGPFLEKIIVENLRDRENDQTVIVKAQIRKPSNFFIKSLNIDYGLLTANDPRSTEPQQPIVISNTSSKTRLIEVQYSKNDFLFECIFPGSTRSWVLLVAVDLDLSPNISKSAVGDGISKETEDQIENLEQKLKIYKRKGNLEKARKAREKLAKLKGIPLTDEDIAEEYISQSGILARLEEADGSAVASGATAGYSDNVKAVRPANGDGQTLYYRKTPTAIIFFIEPNTTRVVQAQLRCGLYAQEDFSRLYSDGELKFGRNEKCVFDMTEDPISTLIKGELMVHEHKNTDIIKRISLQAKVILPVDWDPAGIPSLSSSINSPRQMSLATESSGTRQMSLANLLMNSSTTHSSSFVQRVNSALSPPPLPSLQLSRETLDVGRLEISKPSSHYIPLASVVNENRSYRIGVRKEKFGDNSPYELAFCSLSGQLAPMESLRVDFQLTPTLLGRHKLSFNVFDITADDHLIGTFTISWHCIQQRYLRFPDLLDETSDLEMGFCYFDGSKKFSKIVPIRVLNVSGENLAVDIQSNLAQQMMVFSDSALENSAATLSFTENEQKTLYLALQPNFYSQGFKLGEARSLVGGVKFSIYSFHLDPAEKQANFLMAQTIKFTTLVGQSTMSVGPRLFDFGRIVDTSAGRQGKEFNGKILIANQSAQLPLEIDWKPSPMIKINAISPISLSANGSSPGKDVAASTVTLEFNFRPNGIGFFNERIELQNLKNGEDRAWIDVRVFVDPGRIIFPDIDGNLGFTRDIGQSSTSIPSFTWENIYLKQSSGDEIELADPDQGGHLKPIEIKNVSQHDLNLYFSCNDMEISIIQEPGDQVLPHGSHSSLIQDSTPRLQSNPSQVFCIKSGRQLRFQLLVCVPRGKEAAILVERASKGEIVHQTGLLLINDLHSGVCIGLCQLRADFGISMAETIPSALDLGRLSFAEKLEDVPVSFQIKNLSQIPLICEPDDFNAANQIFELLWNTNSAPGRIITVGPNESRKVELLLKTSQLESMRAGEIDLKYRLRNRMNPRNDISVRVHLSLVIHLLRVSRLTDSRELALPPLFYPQPSNSVPCDTWFNVTNRSSKFEARFEIQAMAVAELTELIGIEVFNGHSITPLKEEQLVLPPEASAEIRVRSGIKALSKRLINFGPSITDPKGIIFGKISLLTKLRDNDVVREEIPVRGYIEECRSFELSTSCITFKVPATDSFSSYYYGESDSETEETPGTNNGASVKRQYSSDRNSGGAANRMQPASAVETVKETVTVRNLSMSFPLQLKLGEENLSGAGTRDFVKVLPALSENGFLEVPAGGSTRLTLELARKFEGDLKLMFQDLNSLSNQWQSLIMTVQLADRRRVSTAASELASSPNAAIQTGDEEGISSGGSQPAVETATTVDFKRSQLLLRGCKRLVYGRGARADTDAVAVSDLQDDCRYELDLGQQDLGAAAVIKRLTIENSSSAQSCPYKIRVIGSDNSWMSISRTEGTLAPRPDSFEDEGGMLATAKPPITASPGPTSGDHIHQITLSFFPLQRNLYSAYLVIQNLNDPRDWKHIRIMMEVVSAVQGVRTEGRSAFDVFVNGVDPAADFIEMHNLCFFNQYSARSMVLANKESVPLEFNFKVNLPPQDQSELVMSLSRSTARIFKTLVVEPGNSTRVFIHFRPMPMQQTLTDLSVNNKRTASYSTVEEKSIEIVVNCRLVKDFQKTIWLRTTCFLPQLSISQQEIMFNGTWAKSPSSYPFEASAVDDVVQFTPDSKEIVLKNNLTDIDVAYEIINDTRYFLLESTCVDSSIPSNYFCCISIRPNLCNINADIEYFKKEKYVQEHVVVYNKRKPREKYWIVLQLAFGNLSNFFLPPTSKNAYAYFSLEKDIVDFLRSVSCNEKLLLTKIAELANLSVVNRDDLENIHFRFNVIIDKLVYFCTREHAGETFFQLANLLFSVLFESPIFRNFAPASIRTENDGTMGVTEAQQSWPPQLMQLVKGLTYFLAFFPFRTAVLESLRELHKSLVTDYHNIKPHLIQ